MAATALVAGHVARVRAADTGPTPWLRLSAKTLYASWPVCVHAKLLPVAQSGQRLGSVLLAADNGIVARAPGWAEGRKALSITVGDDLAKALRLSLIVSERARTGRGRILCGA